MNTSIREAAVMLRQRSLTCAELCERAISKAEKVRELNAFITETHDLARKHAQTADSRFQAGRPLGELDGLPISIKDNFSTQGIQTTCASKMLIGYKPPYDATVVSRLLNAGGVLMGKTNMDEFGMGTGTVDSCFGPVRNIWNYKFGKETRPVENRTVTTTDRTSTIDPHRHFHHSAQLASSTDYEEIPAPYTDWHVCGGSSGGSAVSVAAGVCFAAVGSDTGGSVRSPAGHVGVVGLKPTYGLISRHGLIPLVNSLDTPGVFTRFVHDAAVVLNLLAGDCPYDSTTYKDKYTPVSLPDQPSVKGLKVGVPKEFHGPILGEDILNCWRDTIAALEGAGAIIVDASLPHNQYAIPTYSVLCCAEVASNMARYDGIQYGHRATSKTSNFSTEDLYAVTRHEGFSDTVRSRILAGNFFLLKENYDKFYIKALKVRRLIYQDYLNVFSSGVDVLLTPTNISDADTYQQFCKEDNRTRTAQQDIYTQSVNLAGVPAITIPVTLSSKRLPIGLQLIGDHFSEQKLLNVAQWIESHAQFRSL